MIYYYWYRMTKKLDENARSIIRSSKQMETIITLCIYYLVYESETSLCIHREGITLSEWSRKPVILRVYRSILKAD